MLLKQGLRFSLAILLAMTVVMVHSVFDVPKESVAIVNREFGFRLILIGLIFWLGYTAHCCTVKIGSQNTRWRDWSVSEWNGAVIALIGLSVWIYAVAIELNRVLTEWPMWWALYLTVIASVTLCVWLARQSRWPGLALSGVSGPVLVVLALALLQQPSGLRFAEITLAVVVASLFHYWMLFSMEESYPPKISGIHSATLGALLFVVAVLIFRFSFATTLGSGWAYFLVALFLFGVAVQSQSWAKSERWPMKDYRRVYGDEMAQIAMAISVLFVFLSLREPAQSSPLPYVPLFNPADVGILLSWATTLIVFRREPIDRKNQQRLNVLLILLCLLFAAAILQRVHYIYLPTDSTGNSLWSVVTRLSVVVLAAVLWWVSRLALSERGLSVKRLVP